MRKEDGLQIIILIGIIAVFIIGAVIAFKLLLGDDGYINKATTEETEYSKNQVLEELNFIITEHYVEAYKKSTETEEKKIEQFYTPEKVIKFLKGYSGGESGDDFSTQDSEIIIEDLKGAENMYFVNISKFKRSIATFGQGENEEGGKDFFFIKKENEETYKVYYKNFKGEDEEIGSLEFNPKI